MRALTPVPNTNTFQAYNSSTLHIRVTRQLPLGSVTATLISHLRW
jgi:hypothetical protein